MIWISAKVHFEESSMRQFTVNGPDPPGDVYYIALKCKTVKKYVCRSLGSVKYCCISYFNRDNSKFFITKRIENAGKLFKENLFDILFHFVLICPVFT